MPSAGLALIDTVFYRTVDLLADLSPSTRLANTMAEPHRGLPFARYLAEASRPRHRRRLTGTIAPENPRSTLWQRLRATLNAQRDKTSDYDQTQCLFFTKLPIELRLIIYEYALAGNTYHIESADDSAPLQSLMYRDSVHLRHRNLPFRCIFPTHCVFCLVNKHCRNLALLKSCRRVYNEAAPILYSHNRFQFKQVKSAFRFLQPLISRDKLCYVRYMHLYLRMPRHPMQNIRTANDWANLWQFFEVKMAGLRQLSIDLDFLEPVEREITETPDGQGKIWLLPILGMVERILDDRCFVLILMARGEHVCDLGYSPESVGDGQEVKHYDDTMIGAEAVHGLLSDVLRRE